MTDYWVFGIFIPSEEFHSFFVETKILDSPDFLKFKFSDESESMPEFDLVQLAEFLEEKYHQYHSHSFIELDPVYVPHQYSKKEDIEISGFFAATLAWGQRPVIIRNSLKLMEQMDNSPFDFIINHNPGDLEFFKHFVHRTFNGDDCLFFIQALKNICIKYKSLGNLFEQLWTEYQNMGDVLAAFRSIFFSIPHPARTKKHVANPQANASAKRLNMFMRWMVRKGNVDFGLWESIPSSALFMPLDVHSARVARKLGLLARKQNDWKAVKELTENLKSFDPKDPVKYDYALFGLGVFEKF